MSCEAANAFEMSPISAGPDRIPAMSTSGFTCPRRLILILWWVGMLVATHWPDIDQYAPDRVRHLRHFDKVVHLSLYLGWALLWAWVLSAGGRLVSRRSLAVLFVGGALYGILDETTQAFVRRQPDIGDWACDLAGLAMALAIIIFHGRRIRGRRATSPEPAGTLP